LATHTSAASMRAFFPHYRTAARLRHTAGSPRRRGTLPLGPLRWGPADVCD